MMLFWEGLANDASWKKIEKIEIRLDNAKKCDILNDHAKQSMLIIQKEKQILRHDADAFQMESVERITYKTDGD